MAKSLRIEIDAALKSKILIGFTRTLESGKVKGYVVAVGGDWFLLALINDDILFGGYQLPFEFRTLLTCNM
ncbi:MAG: hypothetical protein HOP09_18480 [Hyphomicrobium sp.]|nr:hypothetical protein [Hyphomicrobium sp.]